jgi:hypothetical protein
MKFLLVAALLLAAMFGFMIGMFAGISVCGAAEVDSTSVVSLQALDLVSSWPEVAELAEIGIVVWRVNDVLLPDRGRSLQSSVEGFGMALETFDPEMIRRVRAETWAEIRFYANEGALARYRGGVYSREEFDAAVMLVWEFHVDLWTIGQEE